MGFRSTFVSEDTHINFSPQFVAKWDCGVNFYPGNHAPISSRSESVMLCWGEMLSDLQNELRMQEKQPCSLRIVFFHECGGVSRVDVSGSEIVCRESQEWEVVREPTHGDWCRGCGVEPTD